MRELDCEKPSDFARKLGFTSYASPRKIRRWLSGENEPDYASTLLLLSAVGMLRDEPAGKDEAARQPGLQELREDDRLEALRGAVAEVQSTLTDDVMPDLSDVLSRLERLEAALSPGQDHPNDQAESG